MKKERKIAVLGGSFDPVHNGHLALAKAALSFLNADSVKVMPAKRAPHKGAYKSTEAHRLAMLELAFEELDRCVIDRRELDRDSISYSVLSMRELREQCGEDVSLTFVMGWDSLQTLHTWWHWQELFDYVNIAVAARPGYEPSIPDSVRLQFDQRLSDIGALSDCLKGGVAVLPLDEQLVASSDIRRVLQQTVSQSGKQNRANEGSRPFDAMLDEWLPLSVAQYIEQHGLYCPTNN